MNNIRIVFESEEDELPETKVCGHGFVDDHTICGFSTERNTIPGVQYTEPTTAKIDCLQCIMIIDGCKMIAEKYIKRQR